MQTNVICKQMVFVFGVNSMTSAMGRLVFITKWIAHWRLGVHASH